MSLKVDFYLLESRDELSRMKTVCRLVDKVQRLGHRIFVLTEDEKQSTTLDKMMWTFSQSSFLPHTVYDENDPNLNEQKVLIYHHLYNEHKDVLVNLKRSIDNELNSFKRILEVINQDPDIRSSGRDKYRLYKQSQYSISTHNLPH